MKQLPLFSLVACFVLSQPTSAQSIAREWNVENLEAIRIDFPAPTVHARNLFHLSVAMYDAWAAFDSTAVGYIHNETGVVPAGYTVQTAREEAISYAAYRVLTHRYGFSTNSTSSLASFNAKMVALGHDTAITTTIGSSPAALGNRIAASVIAYGANDGANESVAPGYLDTSSYSPVNDPLILQTNDTAASFPIGWADLNRWQPLAFSVAFTQNGQVASQVQSFIGPHWGGVKAFGLNSKHRDNDGLYFNPGTPPQLGGSGDADYKTNALQVLEFSRLLDPADNTPIDLSPSARGNNTLGLNDGTGHAANPVTGSAYPVNSVLHADYGRCVAEFWADGPDSETPPGHWNVLANEVTDALIASPASGLKIGGTGPSLSELEWEVKLYLALNGSLHNTAIAVWGIKAHYDYVRPISAIRYMALLGQCSDMSASNYHASGIPLQAGLVEQITPATTAMGGIHAHLAGNEGEIAVNTWQGEPANPVTQAGGRGWILASTWLPYQRDTFVTPAFAGYVSGHSGFSRAAAEVMTLFTGDAFFPGGILSHTINPGDLLFEYGPTEPVTLQWATYYDAADEAGLSRIYGGIHISPDDGPGRIVGSKIGISAYHHATKYWDGSAPGQPGSIALYGAYAVLTFPTIPGFTYTLFSGTNLTSFPTVESGPAVVTEHEKSYLVPQSGSKRFYRLQSTSP